MSPASQITACKYTFEYTACTPGVILHCTLALPCLTSLHTSDSSVNYSQGVTPRFCLLSVLIRVVTQMPTVSDAVGRHSRTACTNVKYLFRMERLLYSFAGLTWDALVSTATSQVKSVSPLTISSTWDPVTWMVLHNLK